MVNSSVPISHQQRSRFQSSLSHYTFISTQCGHRTNQEFDEEMKRDGFNQQSLGLSLNGAVKEVRLVAFF